METVPLEHDEGMYIISPKGILIAELMNKYNMSLNCALEIFGMVKEFLDKEPN
jgi:hypothetical protein